MEPGLQEILSEPGRYGGVMGLGEIDCGRQVDVDLLDLVLLVIRLPLFGNCAIRTSLRLLRVSWDYADGTVILRLLRCPLD